MFSIKLCSFLRIFKNTFFTEFSATAFCSTKFIRNGLCSKTLENVMKNSSFYLVNSRFPEYRNKEQVQVLLLMASKTTYSTIEINEEMALKY